MPHLKLDEKKIITTIVERNGNRLRFGLTKGSEITTEEGDQISAGHIPVFETKNGKAYQRVTEEKTRKRFRKLHEQIYSYKNMGVAPTLKLLAPLWEYNKS